MAKTKLTLDKKIDIFLHTTKVENLFISEYLPDAPGEYIKVYLFGLMYAQYEVEPNRQELAKLLGISEEEVEEAWIYWDSKGLVKNVKGRDENGEEVNQIIFLNQIDLLYGKVPQAEAAEETYVPSTEDDVEVPLDVSMDSTEFDEVMSERLVDRRLRDLYQKYQITTGRTISRQETSKIEDAVKVYGVEPDIFDFAIDYCADLEKYSVDYIFKVALRWTEEGCRTVEDAKRLLDKHSRRNSWYRQVFKALGFNRLPAPADREIMDRWFDEMECSIGEVLEACAAAAGLRDPNLRYVNKVLENRRAEKGGINVRAEASAPAAPAENASPVSRKVLSDYYEYIRTTDETAREWRIDEVLSRVPEMRDVFDAEAGINSKLLSIKPGSAGLDERQRLRAERIAIEESKKQLLTANGWPADYLNRKYRCETCKDTGYTDEGMVCGCAKDRAAEAYAWHTNKEKA